jgi:hypothetical protein
VCARACGIGERAPAQKLARADCVRARAQAAAAIIVVYLYFKGYRHFGAAAA